MKHIIERFLRMSVDEVLRTFASLPGAVDYTDFVFVPGTRQDRVLLVAHADTVSAEAPAELAWRGNILRLGYRNGAEVGCLGADDRVGVALMWLMRRMGHSILITDQEECGGLGAQAAAYTLKAELAQHQFALQVDRKFDREMVFYDCATPEFQHWMQKCTGFRVEDGTFSDISFICPDVGICGVNLAAGYWNEHSRDETFSYDAWLRTHNVVRALLQREKLPRFVLPPAARPTWGFKGRNRWKNWEWEYEDVPATAKRASNSLKNIVHNFLQEYADDYVMMREDEAWLYADNHLESTVLSWLWQYDQAACEALSGEDYAILENAEAIVCVQDYETGGVEVHYFDSAPKAERFFADLTEEEVPTDVDIGEAWDAPLTTLSGSEDSVVPSA